jgi:hypothetical protein
VSEDRSKHAGAGKGDKAGLGHKVGHSAKSRGAEARAGMGQYIPDRVRGESDGTTAKNKPIKGGKGKAAK